MVRRFVLGLEGNAADSLAHGIEHYVAGHGPTDLKYAVLHVAQAIELYLKARLAKEHTTLIYTKPEDAKEKKAHTVNCDTALRRLEAVGVSIDPQTVVGIKELVSLRNNVQHHRIEATRDRVTSVLGRALRFLESFLAEQLDIALQDILGDRAYRTVMDIIYAYGEKLDKVQREMASYATNWDDIAEGGGPECELYCPECDHATVLVPDPRREDGKAQCFFCGEVHEVHWCQRCEQPMLESATFCDTCRDYFLHDF